MTPTEISNLALSQLPASSITSLDEASIQARYCKLWYNQVLATVLQQSEWRFARKRAVLAVAAEHDRPARWGQRYVMPADLAMVLAVYDENMTVSTPYDFIGTSIYSNMPSGVVEYISTADFNTSHTALFRSALIAALAAAICMPIIKSEKRQAFLAQQADTALQRAQAANMNENRPAYMSHIPEAVAARMGITGLESIVFEGPEVNYPDFDPVATFESELDT